MDKRQTLNNFHHPDFCPCIGGALLRVCTPTQCHSARTGCGRKLRSPGRLDGDQYRADHHQRGSGCQPRFSHRLSSGDREWNQGHTSADAVAAHAQSDVTTAYNALAGQACDNLTGQDLGGMTLTPGVYCFSLVGSVDRDTHSQRAGRRECGLRFPDREHAHHRKQLVCCDDQRRFSPATCFGRSAVPRPSVQLLRS